MIGVAYDVMGEVLFAYVVPENAGASEVELIAGITAHCREVMAGPKVPRRFAFVEELPRNAMGKLDRKILRENHK